MLFYGTMEELAEFLTGRGRDMQLDEAALSLARIEHADLDIAPSLRILDSYAGELDRRGGNFVAAANQYLFEELRFAGNSADYYNPANSCLNEVLDTKTGIPITLSVIYLEVARRLAKPVFGIGAPGHFVVEYDDGLSSIYIDPFHGGRPFDTAEKLPRVDKRQILVRMINNLRRIYFAREAHRKCLQVLNLLLAAYPNLAEEYQQRGIVHFYLGQNRSAKADLERYLELAPDAPNRAEVERQLVSLNRWVVGMN